MADNKKNYRVSRIEGKITWQVEEQWDGGTIRGPFGTKEAAIQSERKYATENGFIDNLVLQETVGEEVKPASAFEKDSEGQWHCIQACSIDIENKEVVFTKGMSFSKGIPFMGVDIAKWLDENV